MTNNLKQANQGCLLLLIGMISAGFTAAGAFSLFALGMGGKSDIPYASVLLILAIIVTALSCLVTPLSGIWGFTLVTISTFKEIQQDRKPQEVIEPYQFRWARVLQAAAIGVALYAIFNLATAGPISRVDGDLAFASFLTGTALFPLLILPLLTVLGSLGGGLGYARLRGRESATAMGALVGGILAGCLACAGFIVYLIVR
jgi:hypothetical protein